LGSFGWRTVVTRGLQIQQQKMQDEESRRLTLLSNIMRAKHDTAKNSISNIR